MSALDEYAPCEECARVPPKPRTFAAGEKQVDGFNDAPALNAAFPGRAIDQFVRHRMEAHDVVAQYDLPERIRCSMRGRHPHKSGLAVRAACGVLLFLGNHCGEASVIGFKAGYLFVKSIRAHEARIRLLQQVPVLQGRLAATTTRALGLFALLRDITREYADFAKEMRQRARSDDRRQHEVAWRALVTVDNQRVRRNVRRTIAEVGLWSGAYGAARLDAARARVCRLAEQTAAPETSTSSVEKMTKEYESLSLVCVDHERLWEAAGRFFARDSLEAALRGAYEKHDDERIARSILRIEKMYEKAAQRAPAL